MTGRRAAFVALVILVALASGCIARSRPTAEFGTLKVKVLDKEGHALEDVRVTVQVPKGHPSIVKTTDQEGIAEFPRSHCGIGFVVRIDRYGFVPQYSEPFEIKKDKTLTIIFRMAFNSVELLSVG